MNYLIDSDIVIWYLKDREKEVNLLKQLELKGNVLISVVTITEVRAGLYKEVSIIIKLLQEYFLPIPVNSQIAELAGEFRQKYNLGIADMLIAATAVITQSKLITYNKKHFPMKEIKLL